MQRRFNCDSSLPGKRHPNLASAQLTYQSPSSQPPWMTQTIQSEWAKTGSRNGSKWSRNRKCWNWKYRNYAKTGGRRRFKGSETGLWWPWSDLHRLFFPYKIWLQGQSSQWWFVWPYKLRTCPYNHSLAVLLESAAASSMQLANTISQVLAWRFSYVSINIQVSRLPSGTRSVCKFYLHLRSRYTKKKSFPAYASNIVTTPCCI